MNFIPVVSSNLRAVAYDEMTHTLWIQFRRSGTYCYSGVPPSVYTGLMAASSKGHYHAQYIKFRYPYARV